jgi:hypothetical protein
VGTELRRPRFPWLAVALALAGCRGAEGGEAVRFEGTLMGWLAPVVARATAEPVAPRAHCTDPVAVYRDGRRADAVCPEEAAARGLTILDLADDWAPSLFGERRAPPDPSRWRDDYVRLANERFEELPPGDRARHDRFLELYGIFPSFGVLGRRLADDERHRCHDAVEDPWLAALDRNVDPWGWPIEKQQSDRALEAELARRVAHGVKERGLASADGLAEDPRYGATHRQWRRLAARIGSVRELQAHLRCEGLLDERAHAGLFDWRTTNGLHAYHRKHMIVSWQLDAETRAALLADSRELDWLAVLRALRERVVDATGLIEDGSARREVGEVAGRVLDAEAFRPQKGREPLASGAPDRVSAAADAAARALGWTSPDETRRFFAETRPERLRVAVELPPTPAYHAPHMDLRAEIDRGEMWFDFPKSLAAIHALQPIERRPALVLHARDGGVERALVRWPTTIGGWQPERVEGKLAVAYKESPAGERIWRDLVVGPVWIPPESTPTRDLVRDMGGGRWRPKRDLVGPSYASAYGLAMLMHHRVDGPNLLVDQGIRTHGSVSYSSIHRGFSHGCHRLHNHQAIRLASFLLRHRRHVERGAEPFYMSRTFRIGAAPVRFDFKTRGYRFELDPPVPMHVLPGTVLGHRERPFTGAVPLPAELAERFAAEAED